MYGAEMAAQMANIRVSYFWNKQRAIMLQRTTNPPMIGQYADDVPLSEVNDEFLDENNRLHPAHSEVCMDIAPIIAQTP